MSESEANLGTDETSRISDRDMSTTTADNETGRQNPLPSLTDDSLELNQLVDEVFIQSETIIVEEKTKAVTPLPFLRPVSFTTVAANEFKSRQDVTRQAFIAQNVLGDDQLAQSKMFAIPRVTNPYKSEPKTSNTYVYSTPSRNLFDYEVQSSSSPCFS